MFSIFAQTVQTDPLTGGAGWAGAGILSLILSWLLFVRLPAQDKMVKDMVDGHNERVDKITVANLLSLEKREAMFQLALDKVISHYEREMTEMGGLFREEMQKIREEIKQ